MLFYSIFSSFFRFSFVCIFLSRVGTGLYITIDSCRLAGWDFWLFDSFFCFSWVNEMVFSVFLWASGSFHISTICLAKDFVLSFFIRRKKPRKCFDFIFSDLFCFERKKGTKIEMGCQTWWYYKSQIITCLAGFV